MEGESITPAPAGNAALTEDQGRKAIADLLSGNPARDTPEVEKQEAPPKRPSWSDEDDDDEPAQAASEDDATDDEEATTETEEEPRVRLPDGTEVTLSEVEEWRKGNLRQSDYTRKTQELAAQRKEYETRQAEIAQKSQHFESQVNLAIAVAEQYFPKPPDPALLHSDPIGYLQEKETYEARKAELQQLYYARDQHRQEQTTAQMREFEEMKVKEGQALLEAMPQLKDKAKLEAFQKDILNALPHYGFSQEDLKSVYDHRLVRMIGDAVAYRNLMSQKSKVEAKAKAAPPVAPVQPVGKAMSPAAKSANEGKNLRQELRQTGNKDIATKLISRML